MAPAFKAQGLEDNWGLLCLAEDAEATSFVSQPSQQLCDDKQGHEESSIFSIVKNQQVE